MKHWILDIILLLVIVFLFGNYVTVSKKLTEQKEIVSRQAAAIETLEKQKSTTIPKYLDSIPDYE